MANINSVEPIINRALRCGYNVMFQSEPAIGKTSEIHRVAAIRQADDPKFFFRVISGASVSPLDFTACMPDMETRTLERFHAGEFPNAYQTPDLKGIIYVGEWYLMGLEASRPLQKLVNHEDVGGLQIPKGVIFVGDGNLASDRSGAQSQSRAIMSRFLHVPLDFDVEPALTYAMSNFHPKIGSFLKRSPQCISNYKEVFDPARGAGDRMKQEGQMGIWASMRSWNRLSDMLYDVDAGHGDLTLEEVQGVGQGIGATFMTHMSLLDNLASLEDIVASPKTIALPTRMDEKFALVYMLALSVKPDTFEPIHTYMRRIETEMQTAFLLTMNARFNDLQRKAPKGVQLTEGAQIRNTQSFKAWVADEKVGRLVLGQMG